MHSIAREQQNRYREAESFAVDLASAATTVYGSGWLERSGIPVLHLTPRVLSALSGATSGYRSESRTVVTPKVHGATADPTLAAAGQEHPVSAPSRAWIPGILAGLALIGVVVVALIAPGRLPHQPVTGANVSVAGAPDIGPATVDLSKPVDVAGKGPVSGPVQLTIAGASVPLGSGNQVVQPDRDGNFTAHIELPGLTRWLIGGAVTGEVRFARPDSTQVVQEFTLRTSQHPLASAMGTGSLLLGLFALAYVESTVRTLRRGYRRPSARYTALPLGALFGLAVWLFISVLTDHEVSAAYGLGCGLAGALAAFFLVLATERFVRAARATR
jgi:hypothetical protein